MPKKARTVTVVLEVETSAPVKALKDKATWGAAAVLCGDTDATVKQVSVQVADKTKARK